MGRTILPNPPPLSLVLHTGARALPPIRDPPFYPLRKQTLKLWDTLRQLCIENAVPGSFAQKALAPITLPLLPGAEIQIAKLVSDAPVNEKATFLKLGRILSALQVVRIGGALVEIRTPIGVEQPLS